MKKVIHLCDGELQKWTVAVSVQSPISCHDANRKTQTNQTKEQNKTQTNYKQKPKTDKNQTNKRGQGDQLLSYDTGNYKSGDSIVSSMVSSSGLKWRSNKTKQNRQRSQRPP